ncbi:hypothetical protein [Flavobacterium capsici]|uniref:Uncharacterized protein n=1 Tax=Flavobacterium capsici TaxID=3075618 RepID=A0AA96EW41_9FLAO|nr:MULTISPECIES: hypothetical protein [unclassified Flavobacterium]WNM19266.1 hypothetical protein RN608_00955 [Flavobacterium sp. PMR2A8]WNM20655.1 hypothetical protein RN605_08125 [Flavobacterium sp. PMTSA4]
MYKIFKLIKQGEPYFSTSDQEYVLGEIENLPNGKENNFSTQELAFKAIEDNKIKMQLNQYTILPVITYRCL